MAEPREASSSFSSSSKPVVVRAKRKSNQERVDAFWLEINERPVKRKLLDLESLSVSESPGKAITEVRKKKLLLEHVETISSSEAAEDVLQSYLPNFSGSTDLKKFEERKDMLKQDKKQEQLRSTARQKLEDLARNARFEQIWKSRKKMKAGDRSLNEICHLYDVVQVDNEDENSRKVQKQERVSPEDHAILCNYLPLLREYIASAADDIESEMRSYAFGEESADDGTNRGQSARANYVYDLYTVKDNTNGIRDETTATTTYPLVQVNYEDDFYDGPSDSDYATDDSNAEDNPLHDYPDEVSTEVEKDEFDNIEDYDSQCEDEVVDVSEDEEDWKWRHR